MASWEFVVPDLKAIVTDYLQNKIKSDEFLIALHSDMKKSLIHD